MIPYRIKSDESTFTVRRTRKNCFECVPRQERKSKFETVDSQKESDRKRWREYHKKRRKGVMEKALEYKGGKCQICNYNRCARALEFHHNDPSTKKFGISHDGTYRPWEEVQEELDKCTLLCANCHREVEDGLLSVV
jgi:hypothetical protein